MQLADMLGRPGLAPEVRHLALALVAICRGDWPLLEAIVRSARSLALPRAGFEEALLQGTLFFGFPRVVSAFEVLGVEWPAPTPPTGGGLSPEHQEAAGRDLFAAIYGRNDEPVRRMLATFHREFHDFVLQAAYGRILSRPGLGARERELLAVAALAALGQTPQLIAHARGALTFGADRQAVQEAMLCGLDDLTAAERVMRRV